MMSSEASNGPSKSPCARPHNATRVASSRLTLEQAGTMDLDGAARAEQEGVHGDGEVGQHVEQARRLEALMQHRAFRRQRAILLPLAQRPQHEALADRQAAGASRPAAAGARVAVWLKGVNPLFRRAFHGLTES